MTAKLAPGLASWCQVSAPHLSVLTRSCRRLRILDSVANGPALLPFDHTAWPVTRPVATPPSTALARSTDGAPRFLLLCYHERAQTHTRCERATWPFSFDLPQRLSLCCVDLTCECSLASRQISPVGATGKKLPQVVGAAMVQATMQVPRPRSLAYAISSLVRARPLSATSYTSAMLFRLACPCVAAIFSLASQVAFDATLG